MHQRIGEGFPQAGEGNAPAIHTPELLEIGRTHSMLLEEGQSLLQCLWQGGLDVELIKDPGLGGAHKTVALEPGIGKPALAI